MGLAVHYLRVGPPGEGRYGEPGASGGGLAWLGFAWLGFGGRGLGSGLLGALAGWPVRRGALGEYDAAAPRAGCRVGEGRQGVAQFQPDVGQAAGVGVVTPDNLG